MAKTVEVDLQVNTNLEPTIKNLRELKKQLRETAAGSKEFDRLSASIRDMEDAIGDAKATNDDFLGQLENASGPLGALGQGIRGAERTFSSFNGALKASIIGIIVGLVAGLAAAFNNNEKAQKKLQPVLQAFEKILGGVFAIVEPLFDTFIDLATKALPYVSDAFKVVYSSVTAVFQSIGKLGSAVGKLISGDFSGAWSDAKESVTGFSKNFDAAKNRYDKGSKEMTALEKENAAKRAEALEKENERKKAAADKAAQEAEVRRQKEKEAEEKALEERKKRLQEEIDFQISLDNAGRERRVTEALEKEAADAKFLEDTTALVDALEAEDTKRKDNEKVLSDARTKISQEEFQAKQQLLNATANGLEVLSDLIGKETGKGKALAVAASLINTYAAIAGQLKAFSGVPIPGYAIVQAITTGLSGFAAVRNILKVQVPNSSGGGSAPSMGGMSASSPAAAATPIAPTFNVVGTSGQNQIAQSLGNQQPVKAFVVANDVSTQQSLDRNIVKTATIG
jgi:small basic protein